MKTPCRIENVNKCPNDSCRSMILRSACSHGHSHTSLVSDDVRIQNSEKKRSSLRKSTGKKITEIADSKSLFQFGSLLETSLQQISLKSTKTISILKENLYKRLENEQNGRSLKTSTPISSLLVQSSFFTSEDSFGNGHSSESMSGRNLARRHVNALSDSEDEGTEDQVRPRITTRSGSNSRTSSSTGRFSLAGSSIHLNSNNAAANSSAYSSGDFSWSGGNNTVVYRNNSSSNSQQRNSLLVQDNTVIHQNNSALNSTQSNRFTVQDDTVVHRSSSSLNSSQMNRLLVQESRFDRLRWIVWRYIYLKIIQWISLDVWLLAKLRENRKAGLALCLLPLLFYLLYCAIISPNSSYIFSPLTSASALSQRFEGIKTACLNLYYYLPSLSTITTSSLFSALYEKSSKRTFCSSSPSPEQDDKLPARQEQLDSWIQESEKMLPPNRVPPNPDAEKRNDHWQEEMAELRQQIKVLLQSQNDQKLERLSYTKDRERQSIEHEINLVKKLKLLEDQQISFGNQQKLEKSSSSKDIEKLFAEQEKLNKKLKILEEQLVLQKLDLADFLAYTEKHFVAAFRSVVDADKTSPYFFFNEWLNSKSKETLSSEIKIVIENIKRERMEQDASNKMVVEGLVRHYLHTLKSSETTFTTQMSDEGIQKIVRDAILLYDADKTGLVDYALESAGGSVVSIRCSESYTEKKGQFSLLGLPLWFDQNSPRTAIQPDVHPGRCWSFKGSQGFLVIQLSYAIRPTGFTLEHIPLSLSPTGSIDSAPREFSVWGLSSETDDKGTLLGHYTYDDKGHPLQYFIVQNSPIFPISYVELKILSNHGNLKFTCLYRFRVHGIQVK